MAANSEGEIECIEYRIIVERTTKTTRYYSRRRTFVSRKENKIVTETFQEFYCRIISYLI